VPLVQAGDVGTRAAGASGIVSAEAGGGSDSAGCEREDEVTSEEQRQYQKGYAAGCRKYMYHGPISYFEFRQRGAEMDLIPRLMDDFIAEVQREIDDLTNAMAVAKSDLAPEIKNDILKRAII
jgi:hypothetical protein